MRRGQCNGGRRATWQRLANGLPASGPTIGRIGIALSASNPQRLFAIVISTNGNFQGFYRSDNGGDSWTNLPNSTLGGEQSTYGWWFGRVWVDPVDQNHVFAAGVYLCESKNSGSSFSEAFSPHPDGHAMISTSTGGWQAKRIGPTPLPRSVPPPHIRGAMGIHRRQR